MIMYRSATRISTAMKNGAWVDGEEVALELIDFVDKHCTPKSKGLKKNVAAALLQGGDDARREPNLLAARVFLSGNNVGGMVGEVADQQLLAETVQALSPAEWGSVGRAEYIVYHHPELDGPAVMLMALPSGTGEAWRRERERALADA